MPLTPRFVLSQTEDVLIVTIRTPHVRVSASTLEVVVDDDTFHFYSPPYLLRLKLPGRLVDDAASGREAKAVYDPSLDNGTVTVTTYKDVNDAGIWEGLDLVGRLLISGQQQQYRQDRRSNGPSIEVLSSMDYEEGTGVIRNDRGGTAVAKEGYTGNLTTPTSSTFADAIGDTPPSAPENAASDLLNLTAPRYGFLNLYHSVFGDLAREGLCHEMLELPEPDTTLEQDRRPMRLDVEADKFNDDRYLEDALLGGELDPEYDDGGGGDMIYDEAVNMKPHWVALDGIHEGSLEAITRDIDSLSLGRVSQNDENIMKKEDSTTLTQLSTDELNSLADIPASHMPPIDFATMNEAQTHTTLLSLLDIIFAYVYDHRTTGGDPTVESSWTVAILSPTLSWFDCYHGPVEVREKNEFQEESGSADINTRIDTPADVFTWCIRRSLIYPYLRSYKLGAMIVADVISILKGGRRMILRCLLQLRKIFENSTGHYLLNKLYVDPLIYWVQSVQEEVVFSFATGLKDLAMDVTCNSLVWKSRIGLDLVRLDAMLDQLDREEESDAFSSESGDDGSTSSSEGDESSAERHGNEEDDGDDVLNDAGTHTKISSELVCMGESIRGAASESEGEKVSARKEKPLIQEI
mmetsp:Transcript_8108/g.17540  ORF Transcript_8108/g.17540 Transcript_8108/m.17540 type:complete len:635 (-) Transcript_8108:226-2130(-)